MPNSMVVPQTHDRARRSARPYATAARGVKHSQLGRARVAAPASRPASSAKITAGRIFGDRQCAVARELTKKFETIYRGTAKDILQAMEKDTVKGEIVFLIGGCPEGEQGPGNMDDLLRSYMADMSLKDAVEEVSKILSLPKKQVYSRALELKE